jgi:hypothetical protein
MVQEVFTGTLIYSHLIPAVLGFFSLIFICNGIMDRERNYTIIGVLLFFAAGLLPFIILPFMI